MFGIEKEYVYQDATPVVCALAKSLLRAEIATQAQWEESKKRPLWFIQQTLRRIMEAAGGKHLHNQFSLGAAVCSTLDQFESKDCRDDRLYIVVDGDQPVMHRIGELYEEMAQLHARLPATFWKKFVARGFGRFFRIVDHCDVWQEITSLEEMGDEGEDQARAKSMEAELPAYVRETVRPLGDAAYRKILYGLSPRTTLAKVLTLADEIEGIANGVSRFELDDYDQEQLMDAGDCWPILSLHFRDTDIVRGVLDGVLNMVCQTTPCPNVILPFDPGTPASVRDAFEAAGAIGKIIALSGQVANLLPWVEE